MTSQKQECECLIPSEYMEERACRKCGLPLGEYHIKRYFRSSTPEPKAETPRFPGYREMTKDEILTDGDMINNGKNGMLTPTICAGQLVGDDVGWYFRPIPVTPAAATLSEHEIRRARDMMNANTPVAVSKTEITTEGETLASSLVDVLSAENADLKAKLDTLQSLYDEAAQEDLMRMSREEALTAALAKAREALEAWTRHFEAVDRCRNGDNDGADIFEATEAYNLAVKLTPAALGGDPYVQLCGRRQTDDLGNPADSAQRPQGLRGNRNLRG